MKKSISKCSLKISNALSLAITLFLCCNSSVAQQKVTTIIEAITPECPQNDIDRYKLEVVNHGDTDAYFNLQFCVGRNRTYGSKKWYMELLQYATIMALKYEYVPACRDVYNIVYRYRSYKGNNSSMTIDEMYLCIACLQIGIEKGDQECKKYLDELLRAHSSLLSTKNGKKTR